MTASLAQSIPSKESYFLRVWCAHQRWPELPMLTWSADNQFAITGCARLLKLRALARDMLLISTALWTEAPNGPPD